MVADRTFSLSRRFLMSGAGREKKTGTLASSRSTQPSTRDAQTPHKEIPLLLTERPTLLFPVKNPRLMKIKLDR